MADMTVTAILGLDHEVGDAVARRFHELGHHIVAADPNANRLAKARESGPDEAVFHHGDLHTRLGLRNCFASAAESFGRIDNAVIIPLIEEPDALLEFVPEHFDKAITKALRGAALGMRVFAERIATQDSLPGSSPERQRQKGTTTFIWSYPAVGAMPGYFTESGTQSAILGASRAGAVDLAEHGIRGNAIVAARPRDERSETWLVKRTPLGRAALADEIADAAGFLSSPQAAIITGATLKLDGGRSVLSGVLD